MANLISYENWVDTYRPITNHLYDIGQVDGFMFETYKSQLAFVQKQNPQNRKNKKDYA